MNKSTLFICAVAIGSLLSCANHTEGAAEKTPSPAKEAATALSTATQNEPIVGQWKLVLVAADENGNGLLDESEKAKGTQMDDYMKLNADGSAEFYTIKLKGRYEIIPNASSGKKYLYLFDEGGTKHPKGAILSVTKDQLVLLDKFGGDSFTVWQRI